MKRASEPNQVSVGVCYRTLSLAVVLVPRPIYLDASQDPFLGNAVGVSAMDIESAGSSHFVSVSVGEMNSHVPAVMGEGVRVVMKRHVKTCPLIPRHRTRYIDNFKEWLKPSDQPGSGGELELTIPLGVQTAEAVVADRLVWMRSQPDPPVDRV
jgi:hypothetical protein